MFSDYEALMKQQGMMQQGLSLVELMIALLLSSLLILGVMTLYLDSDRTARTSQALARLQDSGRIAIDILSRDLRLSGYKGCFNPADYNDGQHFQASNLDPDFYSSAIRGVVAVAGDDDFEEAASAMGLSAAQVSRIVNGTDVIQVRYAVGPRRILEQGMATENSLLDTDSDQAIQQYVEGAEAIITNCNRVDHFAVGNSSSNEDNEINHSGLSLDYPEGAQVFRFSTATYWVGDTGRTDNDGNTVFALYQDDQEVVSGIERLQILYGVRSTSNEDEVRFVQAGGINDNEWNEISALQVGILISDEQAVMEVDSTRHFQLPGVTVQPEGSSGATATYPEDERLRAAFATAVRVRNKVLDD